VIPCLGFLANITLTNFTKVLTNMKLSSHHSMLLSGRSQVSLASDFMWNLNSREANASFGYDYVLRQCRLRGRIDTGGEMRGSTASRRACVRVCVCLYRPCIRKTPCKTQAADNVNVVPTILRWLEIETSNDILHNNYQPIYQTNTYCLVQMARLRLSWRSD
jgi:hypothetical protein